MQVPKKIKILQLDTFYHSYLGSIYTRDVSLRSKSYSGQMQTILQDGFAAVHTVAPYMEELGYEIMWVIGNSYYSQLKWAEEHMPGIHIDQSMMSEIIRHQIEIFQPDVLYTTDPVFFDSKLIKTFKKKPELVIGYLASDIPPQTDWSEFDLILSPLSSLRKEALKIGARESAYFKPGGFPLWIYDEIKIIVPEYNTTFIGQWTNGQHKNRNRLIEILAANAEASLRKDALGLFLSGEVDSIPPAVRKYNVGSKFGLEMYKSLRSGKIAFDARGDIRALKTTMEIADLAANETANMRIFEATGCGVFLLTEYRENLHEYFEIGKEIETFSSESELIDKINYYSTNATAREKIALQGKIRCHSYHSMYQKTRELDNLVKERLSSFKNTKTNHNAMNTINQKEFSVQPVSRLFGFDRGNPIDRYYIEKFLQNNRRDIKGTVVEIAENTYTKRFGNNVTESLILSYTKAPNVDIVGDFATGENIPKSRFDCIILTQTIQFIYDVKSALLNAYNSLRDGGTLLLTASGISQISRYDMDRWGEFWRFTDRTFEALIKDVIPSAEFEIDTFGNVAVAKAFLDGLAYEEIPQDVLDYKDPDYQVLLSVKIKKNSNVTHGYKELLKKEHPHKENAPVHKQPAKQADAYEANVLLYHRIANDPLDTQLLTVTPENFDEHLKVLKNNFNIVPLSSLIRSVKEKSIEPRTIAITFDDGYLDNYTYALPLLEKHRVPATIFVTAGMVGSQEEFWWDALERILFVNNNLPQRLNLSSDKETYDLSLVSPTDKFKAYEIIHSILKNQSVSERSELINALLNWGGLSKEGRQSHRIMNQEELKKISVSPYIEIGSHTVSHQKLSSLGYNEQYQELSNSRTLLESIINKPVTTLSYPFGSLGDINNDTIRATINAGYIAGIANYPAPVNDSANLFAVPRWLVRNWNADNFVRWIGSADKNYFETEMLKERNNNIINFLSR